LREFFGVRGVGGEAAEEAVDRTFVEWRKNSLQDSVEPLEKVSFIGWA
jgi:hypothetical protein